MMECREVRVHSSGSGQGQVAGSCEQVNESLVSIKCGNFVAYLRKQ
jgi:hypothetical protein